MPVFVDHELRRRQVVAVATHLIAEAGLDAVTVRDIAEAANCSTAIVSHYFRNKKELLFLTYQASLDRATERGEAHMASADLRPFLAAIMPIDEERLTEWKIWLAFWAKAAADPEIAEIQRQCVRRTRGNIIRILEELRAKGALVDGLDLTYEARRLLTLIIGMAVQAMFDPEDWPAARQHEQLDRKLRRLYRPGRAPPSITGEATPDTPTRRRAGVGAASA